MKEGMLKWIVALAIVVLAGGWIFGSYTTLVRDEEGIRAQDSVVTLAIDKMVKSVESQGMVIQNFRETLLEVITKTVGPDGRAAQTGQFMTAVSERYPNVPETVWRDASATMNAEYQNIADAQTSKVARIQVFRTHLRSPYYVLARAFGGFPTIDLEKAGQLVVGTAARNARETGTLETVDPFAPKKK